MGRRAANTISATTEAIKKVVREAGSIRREYRIGGEKGLVLITHPGGGASFFLFYTSPNHKARKLKLGNFPATTLAEARTLSLEARSRIDRGNDPAAEKAAVRASMTFQELALRFLNESAKLSASTKRTYAAALGKHVFTVIGNAPASTVTSDAITSICKGIKAGGHIVQAQRVKATVGGVFSWGVKSGYVKSNPVRDVPNFQEVPSVRSRSPSLAEIQALLNAVDQSKTSPSIGIIIKLTILTGQRRSEVAGARVSEVDFATGVWTIAESSTKAGRVIAEGRMKNKTEQRVYLSRQAISLFARALRQCAVGSVFFPAQEKSRRGSSIHGDSVSQAVKRLTGEGSDITIHDMRRGIGNFLKDRGVGKDVRDLILHHKDGSVDAVHYSSSARMEAQCREVWQLWADYVLPQIPSSAAPEHSLDANLYP